MAKTYYAWAPIRYGAERDKDNNVLKALEVPAGEKVTPDKLNLSDDQFAQLVESGAVRELEYPQDMPATFTGSPLDWLRQKAKEAGDLAVAGGLGGSYFGPDAEDILSDPDMFGKVEEEEAVVEETSSTLPPSPTP